MSKSNTFKVLSIDGGGMRGFYSASYLNELKKLAECRSGKEDVDLSDLFQMIAGTSTGAIVGVGLAAGLSPERMMQFYTHYGEKIFSQPLPSKKWRFLWHWRKHINKKGDAALREGLIEAFGETTLKNIYDKRKIALVVPAVNATTHQGWVFKTPHNQDSNHRDNAYSLVDVCLASSAAPIYRSLAAIKKPGKTTTKDLFVDGGLWANNPVLVALSEALRFASPEQAIEIYCLGTSSEIAGDVLDSDHPHWGLVDWLFGGRALELSLDAQAGVFDYLANVFSKHLNRPVSIIRFPQRSPSANQAKLLKLDSTSQAAFNFMQQLASGAADDTNRLMSNQTEEGLKIQSLLNHFSTQPNGATNV